MFTGLPFVPYEQYEPIVNPIFIKFKIYKNTNRIRLSRGFLINGCSFSDVRGKKIWDCVRSIIKIARIFLSHNVYRMHQKFGHPIAYPLIIALGNELLVLYFS